MRILSKVLIIICLSFKLNAQSVPTPGEVQKKPIVLKNATIHVGNGKTIEKSDILLVEGKISSIGEAKIDDAEIIDCTGKHVYPGLIAMNSQLGLVEIEAVRATNDQYEVGDFQANIRSIVAYNTDSRVIPTVRSNGILLAQIVPQGGWISGTSSVVQLDAWNWEDAVYQIDNGLHVQIPNFQSRESDKEEDKLKPFTQFKAIETFFEEAFSYQIAKNNKKLEKTDLRFESLGGFLKGEQSIYFHASEYKQILKALELIKKFKLKGVLVGAHDAYKLTQEIVDQKVAVVLVRTHALPKHYSDPISLPFKMPSILTKAGILVALTDEGFWQQRNLPFHAGTAAAYGLTTDEALSLITLNPAKILGIETKTGSIEVGKDANLLVVSGDLLDMKSSKIENAFIQGRKMDLNNHQTDLYEKFSKKLNK